MTIEESGYKFKVYFNKNVHKTLDQYLRYLSASLNVSNPELFQLKKLSHPYTIIKDVSEFQNGLELLLIKKT